MAKKAKSDPVKIDAMEKVARLLAIHVSKNMDADDVAVKLLAVGFDSPTIGLLLNKNPNFANAAKSKFLKAAAKDKA